MTRQRLRPAHTPGQLADLYARPHEHARFVDHRLRVPATIAVAQWMLSHFPQVDDLTVADLSCGDGAVLAALDLPAERKIYGDLAPGYPITGPLEETITQLPRPVDLFVCGETIEHLDDPDLVLKALRQVTGTLVLSTPVDAWGDDNPEHYWAWSRLDVEAMLATAAWRVLTYVEVDCRPAGLQYSFGIWGCT